MRPLDFLAGLVMLIAVPAGIQYAYHSAIDGASHEPQSMMPESTPFRGICADSADCLGPALYGTPEPFKGIAAR